MNKYVPKGSQKLFDNAVNFCNFLNMSEVEVWYYFSCASLRNGADKWSELYDYNKNVNGKVVQGNSIRSKLKRNLVEIQSNRCCYCKRSFQNISHAKPLEHVLPRKVFPQFSVIYQNICLSCFDCNQQKKDSNWSSLPNSIKTYPLSNVQFDFFHPRFHEFDDHVKFFRIETNNITISAYVGVSEIGRKLCVNLLDTVSKREFLINNNSRLSKIFPTILDFGNSVDEGDAPSFYEAYRMLGEAVLGTDGL